jgi:hypothetical protein
LVPQIYVQHRFSMGCNTVTDWYRSVLQGQQQQQQVAAVAATLSRCGRVAVDDCPKVQLSNTQVS